MNAGFVWPPFKVDDVVYRLLAVGNDLTIDEVRIDAVRLTLDRKARFYLSTDEWTDDETRLYSSLTGVWHGMQESGLEPPVSGLWIIMKPLVDAAIRPDPDLGAVFRKTRDGVPVMIVRLTDAWKLLVLEFGNEVALLGFSNQYQFRQAVEREGLLVSRPGSNPPNYRFDLTVDGVRKGHLQAIDITAWIGSAEALEVYLGCSLRML